MFELKKKIKGVLAAPIEYPTPAFLSTLGRKAKFTPDITLLQAKKEHRVLIVDEQMHALGQHRGPIQTEAPLAVAFTVPNFSVWKTNEKGDSTVVPLPPSKVYEHVPWADQRGAPPAPIKGELFGLTAERIAELDKYKENGVRFNRVEVQVEIPHSDVRWFKDRSKLEDILGRPLQHATVRLPQSSWKMPAFMYVGNPNYWDGPAHDTETPIRVFSPVKVFVKRDNERKYYQFTKNDLR